MVSPDPTPSKRSPPARPPRGPLCLQEPDYLLLEGLVGSVHQSLLGSLTSGMLSCGEAQGLFPEFKKKKQKLF